MMEMMVCVVDDDDTVRRCLDDLLRSVGLTARLFAGAEEFLASCDLGRVGCLLLDVRMPGMSGLMLQDQLIAHKIDVPIIFLSGHADLAAAVTAMKKGARDFFLKPFSNQALLDGVHQALERARRTQLRRAREAEVRGRLALLTPKETEILERIRSSQSAKVVAHDMGLSRKTIDTHLAAIRRKMRAESTAELMLLLQDHLPQPLTRPA